MSQQQNQYPSFNSPTQRKFPSTYKLYILNLSNSIPYQDQLSTIQNLLSPYDNELLKIGFEKRDKVSSSKNPKIEIITKSKKLASDLSKSNKLPSSLLENSEKFANLPFLQSLKIIKAQYQSIQSHINKNSQNDKNTQKFQKHGCDNDYRRGNYDSKNGSHTSLSSGDENTKYTRKNDINNNRNELKNERVYNTNSAMNGNEFYDDLTYELYNYHLDEKRFFWQKSKDEQLESYQRFVKRFLVEILMVEDLCRVEYLYQRVFISVYLDRNYGGMVQRALEFIQEQENLQEIQEEVDRFQSCKYVNFFCRFYGTQKEVENHIENECLFRPKKCQYCGKLVMNLTQSVHNNNCPHLYKNKKEQEEEDEYQDKMLIIQNFPKNRNFFDIKKFLEMYGPVQNFSFKYEEKTKVLNFFCKFERQEDAVYAKSQLHNLVLYGNAIQIEFHKSKEELQKSRVYVKGLEISDTDNIKSYMESKYGKVKMVKMLQNIPGKKAICYVEFQFLKAAQNLIKNVQVESACALGQNIRYCTYSLEYLEKLNEKKCSVPQGAAVPTSYIGRNHQHSRHNGYQYTNSNNNSGNKQGKFYSHNKTPTKAEYCQKFSRSNCSEKKKLNFDSECFQIYPNLLDDKKFKNFVLNDDKKVKKGGNSKNGSQMVLRKGKCSNKDSSSDGDSTDIDL